MDLGIEGKVAIVTGGSNGIGRAAAERFSMEGALVAVVSRTQSDLDQVARQISELSGNEVLGIAADVSDEKSVESMVRVVASKWNRIDILVNNAGTSMGSTFEAMTNEMVEQDFALKVMGAIYCTRYALPYLKKSGGAICNTTTPGGKAPGAGSQPTALSRSSGISLTKTWSKEDLSIKSTISSSIISPFLQILESFLESTISSAAVLPKTLSPRGSITSPPSITALIVIKFSVLQSSTVIIQS